MSTRVTLDYEDTTHLCSGCSRAHFQADSFHLFGDFGGERSVFLEVGGSPPLEIPSKVWDRITSPENRKRVADWFAAQDDDGLKPLDDRPPIDRPASDPATVLAVIRGMLGTLVDGIADEEIPNIIGRMVMHMGGLRSDLKIIPPPTDRSETAQ